MNVSRRHPPADYFRQRLTPQMSLALGLIQFALAVGWTYALLSDPSPPLPAPFYVLTLAASCALGGALVMRYFLLRGRNDDAR